MSGVKGKSGRKRKSKTRSNAMHSMTLLAPIAVLTIEETIKGTNKDRLKYEAAVEVYNHNFGKPRQRTEMDITGGENLGAGLVQKIFDKVDEAVRLREARYNVLIGGENVQGQIEAAGSEQVSEPKVS